MTCATCPGACQSAVLQASLAELTALTTRMSAAIADLSLMTIEDRDRLNAHWTLIEQHHRQLNRLLTPENPT